MLNEVCNCGDGGKNCTEEEVLGKQLALDVAKHVAWQILEHSKTYRQSMRLYLCVLVCTTTTVIKQEVLIHLYLIAVDSSTEFIFLQKLKDQLSLKQNTH